MMATCPDCGAPVGEDRLPTVGCWLRGQIAQEMQRGGDDRTEEQIRRYLAGGGDPPCIHYNYDHGQKQLSQRRRRRSWFLGCPMAVTTLVVIWLMMR